MTEKEVEFITADGLVLSGSLCETFGDSKALLIHGAGSDRAEDGLFDKAVQLLQGIGIKTLRFDLRGHGKSQGKRESVTLTSTLNDIDAGVRTLCSGGEPSSIHLIGSSFSGGITAYYAAKRQAKSLILINPVLDYKYQYLTSKPYWNGLNIAEEGRDFLNKRGWIDHKSVLKLSRHFLGELFWIDSFTIASDINIPVLLFHGTNDQRVPYEISETWISRVSNGRLITIHGADHEIAVSGDHFHKSPQTIKWHKKLLGDIKNWIQAIESGV